MFDTLGRCTACVAGLVVESGDGVVLVVVGMAACSVAVVVVMVVEGRVSMHAAGRCSCEVSDGRVIADR